MGVSPTMKVLESYFTPGLLPLITSSKSLMTNLAVALIGEVLAKTVRFSLLSPIKSLTLFPIILLALFPTTVANLFPGLDPIMFPIVCEREIWVKKNGLILLKNNLTYTYIPSKMFKKRCSV